MIARTMLALSLAALTAIPGAASAAPREQNFGAHLTGAAERPTPRETPAQGQATFHLNPDGTIDYRLIASNIDNVAAAHVHCSANEDGTAPAIVHLDTTHPGNSDGVNSSGTFSGDTLCSDGKTVLEAMRAGLAYVNVHTNDGDAEQNEGPGDFPGGEIRGQIEPRGSSA
jgi:hypothetical protein